MSDIGLEIHHLDVRGGDATVILVKDLEKKTTLYSLLIDAGAEKNGSAFLEEYLVKHLQTDFDCMIATHYHDDHIKGLSQENSIRFTNFVDNGGYQDGTGVEPAPNGIGSGTNSDVFADYQTRIEIHLRDHKATRIKIPFVNSKLDADKKPFRIRLGHDDIHLVCYSANGILADGQNVLATQRKTKRMKVNPNDLSLAFVLEWGKFRYFTAGDLSGDGGQSSYYDIESSLVAYLAKQNVFPSDAVSVFKASHHGSEHSNQLGLLKLVNPSTVVVSVNLDKKVPSPIFLARLNEHFSTDGISPNANVVFSNRLLVEFEDARSNPLLELLNANRIVPANIKSGMDTHDNLKVKCVIIRRRVKNGSAVAFDDVPKKGISEPNVVGRLAATSDAYEVVMVRRDENETTKIQESARPKSYKFSFSWDALQCSADDIKEGFTGQAESMAYWYTTDKNKNQTLGKDYVTLCFPSLVEIWNQAKNSENLKATVLAEMIKMFGLAFSLNEKNYFQPRNPKNLTARQRLTLQNLLWRHSRQYKFNHTLNPHAMIIFWNENDKPEPYVTTGTLKRKAAQPKHSDRVRKTKKIFDPSGK